MTGAERWVRLVLTEFEEKIGGSSNCRSPFARAKNPPGREAGLGDHRASGLRDRDQVGENARMAPGHRLLRRADRLVFVAVRVFHQDRADEIGPQLPREIAAREPFALEVAANLRPRGVDRAAAAEAAVPAQGTGRLVW